MIYPVALQDFLDPVAQIGVGHRGREAEIEHHLEPARYDVLGTGPAVDIRDLEAGRGEIGVALVPFGRGQLRQRWCQPVNGIIRQLRVGNVPLLAMHEHAAGERAAPADLDGIAQGLDAGRFADDAVVDLDPVFA